MIPILGTAGADSLSGEAGADTLVGLAGDDLILGNAGDDLLQGSIGLDIIDGGDGDDTIEGGAIAPGVTEADDDTIFGGDGIDTVAFTGAFADFTITAAEVPLPDSETETLPGFQFADMRSPETPSGTNGTDLVANDVELVAFAAEGSVLSLADFEVGVALEAPILTTIATTDTAALPADSPTTFVEAIAVETADDGTTVEPVIITPEALAVQPATVDGVAAEVTFTVEVLPTVGTLLLNGEVLAVEDSFTPDDLAAGALSYAVPEVTTFSVSELFPSVEFSVASGPFTLEDFPAIPAAEGAIANPVSAGTPLALSFNLLGDGVDLNVDGVGDEADPFVDVLNIFRVLAGAPQAVVVTQAAADTGVTQQSIVTAAEALPDSALNVDGVGDETDPFVDVLNIFRVLAGAPQAVVVTQAAADAGVTQQSIVTTVETLFS